MTQIKQGLFKSPDLTYVVTSAEDNGLSRDKKPSPELFEMIQAAASSLTGFAQLWESIRKKGTTEGFSDAELQDMLRPLLRDRLGMSKDKIYYLFHQEEKKEQSKQSYHRNIPPVLPKKEPEQSYNPEEEIKKIGEIRRAEQKREAEGPIVPDDEDPKDIELRYWKERAMELEDALKKTEMFKPATEVRVEDQPITMTDEAVFDWLAKRENRVTCYWYPNYGINLFRTRILTDLENSGVKMFKRLYFEV